jgi:hypothetical protein
MQSRCRHEAAVGPLTSLVPSLQLTCAVGGRIACLMVPTAMHTWVRFVRGGVVGCKVDPELVDVCRCPRGWSGGSERGMRQAPLRGFADGATRGLRSMCHKRQRGALGHGDGHTPGVTCGTRVT